MAREEKEAAEARKEESESESEREKTDVPCSLRVFFIGIVERTKKKA